MNQPMKKDELTEEEEQWLNAWLEDLAENHGLMEFLEKERERLARGIPRLCPWGCCEVLVDPIDNQITTTIGLVGCGCDNLPGWRSKYYEGLPKPGWNIKPVGRHGGKIARSRKKHREHENYMNELRGLGWRY